MEMSAKPSEVSKHERRKEKGAPRLCTLKENTENEIPDKQRGL